MKGFMNFTYKELTTESEVLELIRWHNANSKYIYLDVETTGLNPFTDGITDIVLNSKEKFSSVIFSSRFISAFKELLVPVIAHNFKFDFNFLYRNGVNLRIPGLYADTMLLDHLLNENEEHSLDSIVKRRYNDNYKEVFWDKYKNYSDAPHEVQVEYACKDIIYTEMVYEDLTFDLEKAGIPDSLIQHVHSLALTLYDTEIKGIKLDLDYLNNMGAVLSGQIAELQVQMRSEVELECLIIENDDYWNIINTYKTDKGRNNAKKRPFNFDSSQQLGILLYDKLNLPEQLSNARKRTVDDGALQRIEAKHSIIPRIREYRGLQKVYTSFIEGSLKKMFRGRIHPSFNINGTVTGRISSSQPNMQQLPKDGGVRGIYVPDPDFKFLSCDYAQLEVSLAAHFSRDKNLLKIVYEGASQHDITAQGLGIGRTKAKHVNFAMQYGAGVKKIQAILSCSPKDAEFALNKYWETYTDLYKFIKECHKAVDDGIPLVNPFGRQRHFPIKFKDKWERESAYRQAANSLIQGTGADITSRSLYLTSKNLKENNIGRTLFSVHDEILIEVANSACDSFRNTLISIMEGVGKEIRLTVPLKAECSTPMTRWMKG